MNKVLNDGFLLGFTQENLATNWEGDEIAFESEVEDKLRDEIIFRRMVSND